MIASIAMILTTLAYQNDAYIICGPNPLKQCLETVSQCLTEEYERGEEPDFAFEICAESVDPTIVH
jgi:hypothetical protein